MFDTICQVTREDLGAQFDRIARRLIASERPLLEQRGLTMWEYVALRRLRVAPAATQLQLARAMRYDKTRLIALLDGLEQAGLIKREPAPEDRRARVVTLTAAGRRRVDAAQRDIHAMEDALLTPAQRAALQRLLDRFAPPLPVGDRVPDEADGHGEDPRAGDGPAEPPRQHAVPRHRPGRGQQPIRP